MSLVTVAPVWSEPDAHNTTSLVLSLSGSITKYAGESTPGSAAKFIDVPPLANCAARVVSKAFTKFVSLATIYPNLILAKALTAYTSPDVIAAKAVCLVPLTVSIAYCVTLPTFGLLIIG